VGEILDRKLEPHTASEDFGGFLPISIQLIDEGHLTRVGCPPSWVTRIEENIEKIDFADPKILSAYQDIVRYVLLQATSSSPFTDEKEFIEKYCDKLGFQLHDSMWGKTFIEQMMWKLPLQIVVRTMILGDVGAKRGLFEFMDNDNEFVSIFGAIAFEINEHLQLPRPSLNKEDQNWGMKAQRSFNRFIEVRGSDVIYLLEQLEGYAFDMDAKKVELRKITERLLFKSTKKETLEVMMLKALDDELIKPEAIVLNWLLSVGNKRTAEEIMRRAKRLEIIVPESIRKGLDSLAREGL
jgi:hypothetical protein